MKDESVGLIVSAASAGEDWISCCWVMLRFVAASICDTDGPLDCSTVQLSDCPTVRLSDRKGPSNRNTVRLSDCLTVQLPTLLHFFFS